MWTKNILKTDLFENDDHTTTLGEFIQTQIQIDWWLLHFQISPVYC